MLFNLKTSCFLHLSTVLEANYSSICPKLEGSSKMLRVFMLLTFYLRLNTSTVRIFYTEISSLKTYLLVLMAMLGSLTSVWAKKTFRVQKMRIVCVVRPNIWVQKFCRDKVTGKRQIGGLSEPLSTKCWLACLHSTTKIATSSIKTSSIMHRTFSMNSWRQLQEICAHDC